MIRVVLADDQTLIRQGIASLLALGGEVEVVGQAEDGDDALAQIRALRPDVALLDVRMPRKTGVEVVQALRLAGDATAAILLTTFDDEDALREGIRAGIAGWLLKDLGVRELLEAIRSVAAGKTLLLPSVSERAMRSVAAAPIDFDSADLAEPLTAREREVLRLIAGGYSNREIADALGSAEGTVKNQTSNILSKLGVRDRTRAVLVALKRGWLV